MVEIKSGLEIKVGDFVIGDGDAWEVVSSRRTYTLDTEQKSLTDGSTRKRDYFLGERIAVYEKAEIALETLQLAAK